MNDTNTDTPHRHSKSTPFQNFLIGYSDSISLSKEEISDDDKPTSRLIDNQSLAFTKPEETVRPVDTIEENRELANFKDILEVNAKRIKNVKKDKYPNPAQQEYESKRVEMADDDPSFLHLSEKRRLSFPEPDETIEIMNDIQEDQDTQYGGTQSKTQSNMDTERYQDQSSILHENKQKKLIIIEVKILIVSYL